MASEAALLQPKLRFERAGYDGGIIDHVFAVGLHVIVSEDIARALPVLQMGVGVRRPRPGRVTLGDQVLFTQPRVRRAVASWLGQRLPALPTVRAALDAVAAMRGHSPLPALSLIDAMGNTPLLDRAPAELTAAQNEDFHLALTLGHETAQLMVLHDVLAPGSQRQDWLTTQLTSLAADRIVVVSARAVPSGLERYSSTLRHGALVAIEQAPANPLSVAQLLIRATPAEVLLERLLAQPGVLDASLEDGGSLLRVQLQHSTELETRLCLHALAEAQRLGIDVHALRLHGSTDA